MKRLFTSILLLFASVLAVCAMSSCRFTKPETFEFKLKDDGTYEVAVFNNWGQEELEIPATYKDKPVTSILIPYPEGTTKYIYITPNDEFAIREGKNESIYHYNEETDTFNIEQKPWFGNCDNEIIER